MKNIPILEHDCGDFAITYKGGEYHPHDGEAVWFIPYLSMPDMIELMKLGETKDDQTFLVLQESVAPILADVIDHWTWTGVRSGKPLGKQHNGTFYKPEAGDVAALSHQEVMYLVDAFFKTSRGDEEENPQPDSSEQS
jgi:hypothetical protein